MNRNAQLMFGLINISIIILLYLELNKENREEVTFETHAQKLRYDMEKLFEEPIIFVGGYMSSGTTLMRSILDVHPEVKCGPELKITIETFASVKNLTKNKQVKMFIDNAYLTDEYIQKAMGLFGFYLFVINVPNANRICNKEPLSSKFIDMYKNVFPNSKYIYLLRDGREVAYSIIKRWFKRNITFTSFYEHLTRWNNWNKESYYLCLKAGSDYCKVVRYEDLVTKAEETIRDIAKFLNLEWTDKFLNHQEYLEKDIKLSKNEPSLYGITKKINDKSLRNWMGKINDYDEMKISTDFEMLHVFNYIY